MNSKQYTNKFYARHMNSTGAHTHALNAHIYIRTYVHYMQTYIHTHTYIHTYVRTYVHTLHCIIYP